VVDGHIPGGFGQGLDLGQAGTLALEDGVLQGRLVLRCTPATRLSGQPVFTVSQSEAGFEKIMQAVELELAWNLAAGVHELHVELTAGQGID
ncbi:MAG: DUF1926 domain-containing protein, partial [Burkholderiales bacterium]|nr:DUF1926 domain-containing protein [Burkholderiales bacterium]